MYNCTNSEIVIPQTYFPTITTLFVASTCCGDYEEITFCNPNNKINILNLYLNISNLVQNKELPTDPCFIEMNWDERISANLTNVVSFTGTKKTYIDSVLTNSEDLGISHFNTFHNEYTSFMEANRFYEFELIFTLINGIIITYNLTYNPNLSFSGNTICSINNFSQTMTYDYDCVNEVTYFNGNAHFNIALKDGFYTIKWENYKTCFVVDCEESIDCMVKTHIGNLLNLECYDCNKKEDLEKVMQLLFNYKALNSDCLDCCDKCAMYKEVLELTTCCDC